MAFACRRCGNGLVESEMRRGVCNACWDDLGDGVGYCGMQFKPVQVTPAEQRSITEQFEEEYRQMKSDMRADER